jgi:hypothetical protein
MTGLKSDELCSSGGIPATRHFSATGIALCSLSLTTSLEARKLSGSEVEGDDREIPMVSAVFGGLFTLAV